jgi:hypothetical protein
MRRSLLESEERNDTVDIDGKQWLRRGYQR